MAAQQRMKPGDVPFAGLCQVLDAVKASQANKRAKHLKHFHDNYLERDSNEYFFVYRLFLPHMDRERGYYAIKEQKLARVLIEACGLSSQQNDAKELMNWRQGATSKFAGDLVETASKCLLVKHCESARGSSTLKVSEFNALLDRLAASGEMKEQAIVLRTLILKLSPEEMKWALRIILRSKMHLGVGEKPVLGCLHPKALDYFNTNGMNLRKVCERLNNPNNHVEILRVIPGSVVRPQLAERVNSVEAAWAKVKDQEFVVETKFDGERIQLHKLGDRVWYYTRSGIDHGEYSGYHCLNQIFHKQVKHQDCVLDGEIIIWNKKVKKFLPFGTIKHIVNLIKSNNPSVNGDHRIDPSSGADKVVGDDEMLLRDLEVTYVAFDVLYTEHQGTTQSVIHLPLSERHKLLERAVAPVDSGVMEVRSKGATGRIIPLLPGKCEFSRYGTDESSLQKQFDESIAQLEEGIVIKALQSEWVPAMRTTHWLKLKPDYATEVDVDGMIIGANYGMGRRGGVLAQYLLGIPKTKGNSNYLLSFCRVGTGLCDADQREIHTHLQGNIGERPPPMYRITGDVKERPHVWVQDPAKSICLEVIGDVRMIPSRIFACGKSLRFPRAKRMRKDKGLADLTTLEDIQEHEPEHLAKKSVSRQEKKREEIERKRKRDQVEVVSRALSDYIFHIVNYPPSSPSRQDPEREFNRRVEENGGEVTRNYLTKYGGQRTQVCVAAAMDWRVRALWEREGVDVMALSYVPWLLKGKSSSSSGVSGGGRPQRYRPKHYLCVGRDTRARFDLDDYGDAYDQDLDAEDLGAILERMEDLPADARIDEDLV